MRLPWKLLGVAGLAGVAASGAVVVRRRRSHEEYDPEALRAKLHDRLAATRGETSGGPPAGDAPTPSGAEPPPSP